MGSCTVQTQPLVKHWSSGDSWLALLWPPEEGKVSKTVDVYILDHSSMERVKDARYFMGMVPKGVITSDLTVTSTISCSSTLSL